MKSEQINELIKVYPYNLAYDILMNEEKVLSLSINGIITELCLLEDIEKEVLRLRYEEDLTLKKIGEELGVNMEKVRRVRDKVLRRLRHPSSVSRMKSYSYDEVAR